MANPYRAGKLRRDGREAFAPGEDPDTLNPYLNERRNAWGSEMHAKYWRDGWDEAAAEQEVTMGVRTYCEEVFDRLWRNRTDTNLTLEPIEDGTLALVTRAGTIILSRGGAWTLAEGDLPPNPRR